MKERYAKPLPAVVLGGVAAATLVRAPLDSGQVRYVAPQLVGAPESTRRETGGTKWVGTS